LRNDAWNWQFRVGVITPKVGVCSIEILLRRLPCCRLERFDSSRANYPPYLVHDAMVRQIVDDNGTAMYIADSAFKNLSHPSVCSSWIHLCMVNKPCHFRYAQPSLLFANGLEMNTYLSKTLASSSSSPPPLADRHQKVDGGPTGAKRCMSVRPRTLLYEFSDLLVLLVSESNGSPL